jgi:phosphatidylethanolamine/phosphatidyl-N-methylethanolamine N-methyltransferase
MKLCDCLLFKPFEFSHFLQTNLDPLFVILNPILSPLQPVWKEAQTHTEGIIDISSPILIITICLVLLAPIIWNTLARLEYYTHILTKLFLGNRYWGCYALALWIFFFSLYRDFWYFELLKSQPVLTCLTPYLPPLQMLAAFLFLFGSSLVLSSFIALGITGTYLGDYFGILMQERVTGFPFNVMDNPMYNGSSIIFLSHAIHHASPAGVLVTIVVFLTYRMALLFEEPFTTQIYTRAQSNKTK